MGVYRDRDRGYNTWKESFLKHKKKCLFVKFAIGRQTGVYVNICYHRFRKHTQLSPPPNLNFHIQKA